MASIRFVLSIALLIMVAGCSSSKTYTKPESAPYWVDDLKLEQSRLKQSIESVRFATNLTEEQTKQKQQAMKRYHQVSEELEFYKRSNKPIPYSVEKIDRLYKVNNPEGEFDFAKLNDLIINGEVSVSDGYRLSQAVASEWKCSLVDFRIIHGCFELRFFDPSTRVYFEREKDKAGKADLFKDGGLDVSLDFISMYFPWRFGAGHFYDRYSWGPMISAGISSSSSDTGDGAGAMGLVSTGMMLEYKTESKTSLAFEVGHAWGFSANEEFSSITDKAWFMGIKINVPLAERNDQSATEILSRPTDNVDRVVAQ
ncbi:TPA: hypothetical protein RQL08_000402 [Vibrio vulnificus]|nr:hypothetical protein [Vibrio vulnificus]HDY8133988.1 hypothetical protein [Vibrio vulnificus]HDY8146712.1 hypothetical protein [Vibrio vulnificus]HDY8152029.1 hypothetical protein [Vibrio vulnificus]